MVFVAWTVAEWMFIADVRWLWERKLFSWRGKSISIATILCDLILSLMMAHFAFGEPSRICTQASPAAFIIVLIPLLLLSPLVGLLVGCTLVVPIVFEVGWKAILEGEIIAFLVLMLSMVYSLLGAFIRGRIVYKADKRLSPRMWYVAWATYWPFALAFADYFSSLPV